MKIIFRGRIAKAYILVAVVSVVAAMLTGAVFLEQKNSAIEIKKINSDGDSRVVLSTPGGPDKTVLNFSFVGDIMLDRYVGSLIKKNSFAYIFENIKDTDFFKNKDIIGANLEGSVTNNGQHYSPNNGLDFAFLPESVAQLKNYGFNFFNLANNHFADQGQRGLDETRLNLDNLGFNYAGCPDGQIGDCSTKIIEIKNQKIGFAGFSAVYSKLDLDGIKNTIVQLKKETDFVIVNFHWGNEYQHQFSQGQQEYAHALIDAGADLIIGHHPHVVQGLEVYKGKAIFYSLGNFIFDQYFSVDTQQGLALAVDFDNQNLEFMLEPFGSKQSQPDWLTGKERADFFQKLSDWSQADKFLSDQIQSGGFVLAR